MSAPLRRDAGAAIRWRSALCALGLILAACASQAPTPPEPSGFRRAGAPIGSATLFEPERFAGTWHQTAQFGTGCLPATLSVTQRSDGLAVTSLCDGRRSETVWQAMSPARYQTPEGPVWVLWVDQSYRTVVLGRPDGRWGAVWNRTPRIPEDRAIAAREILDFNGYDVERLRVTAR